MRSVARASLAVAAAPLLASCMFLLDRHAGSRFVARQYYQRRRKLPDDRGSESGVPQRHLHGPNRCL